VEVRGRGAASVVLAVGCGGGVWAWGAVVWGVVVVWGVAVAWNVVVRGGVGAVVEGWAVVAWGSVPGVVVWWSVAGGGVVGDRSRAWTCV